MKTGPAFNPPEWRDDDRQQRLAIAACPASPIAAALRASYDVQPLPADFARLIARLR